MTQITVFISSKMQELRAERDLIRDYLPALNEGIVTLKPWIFEADAPASEDSIREVYLEALQNSELYIGIFWNDYGEWTIDEFERAGEWNIPRHIYVKDVDAHKRDPRLTEFLNKHGDVTGGITAKWFKTEDDLKQALEQSLGAWVKNSLRYRPGASRAALYRDPDDITEASRSGLVGRDPLINEINDILAESNARLLLQAFGGTGKTVLAARVAEDYIEAHNTPVLWLRMGASERDAAFEALAHAFDASKQMAATPAEDKPRLLRQLIRGQNIGLVVLDDAWNGQTLQAVLGGIPRKIPVLVTARQRYAIETIISVPDLQPDDAYALLRKLARDFTSDETDTRALAEALHYHAFALDIAGRTMQTNSYLARKMLGQIQSADLTQVTIPLDFQVARRESIAALIQTTLTSLPDDARAAFFAWGAFWSPVMTVKLLDEYWTVVNTPDKKNIGFIGSLLKLFKIGRNTASEINIISQQLSSGLDSLVHHGLASYQPDQKTVEGYPLLEATYRLHDLAFEYASAQTDDAAQHCAVDACLRLIAAHKQPARENFAALEPLIDSFMGAADFAMVSERYSDVEDFAWGLYAGSEVMRYRGYTTQALRLLRDAAHAAEKGGTRRAQGTHLGNLGLAYSDLGEYQQAIDYHQQALTIQREIGDRQGEGNQLGNLGSAYFYLSEYQQAIDYHQQALVISRQIGNRRGEGHELSNLGTVYLNLGNYLQSIEYYQQALVIHREIGDRHGEGHDLGNLGNAYHYLGDYQQAIDYHQQALVISRQIGNRHGEGGWLGSLGLTYADLGDYQQAIEYTQQALVIAQEMGDRSNEANWLTNLGIAYNELGDYEKAIDYHQQALVISRQIGDRRGEGYALGNLGRAYGNLGDYEKAIDYHQQALVISQEIGDRRGEGSILTNLGIAYADLGDYQQAIEYYQQTLAIFRALGVPHLIEQVEGLIADVQRKQRGEKSIITRLRSSLADIFRSSSQPSDDDGA